MAKISDLASYANKEASNMGLEKPLDIKVDSRLGFNHYINTKSSHKIRLVNSNKLELRHELGHAYMSEKFSRLFNFFDKFSRPLNFLGGRFGESGDMVSNIIYSLTIGVIFFFGIFFADRAYVLVSSLFFFVGIVLALPMIEELMAYYFGKKFSPKN